MFFVSFMDLLSEIFKGIVGALIIASAIYFLMIGLEKINEFSDEVKKKGTKGSRLRCYAAVIPLLVLIGVTLNSSIGSMKGASFVAWVSFVIVGALGVIIVFHN